MARTVWIKLFIGVKDQSPAMVKIKSDLLGDISDLKKEIKAYLAKTSGAVDADRLAVFGPGTSYPIVGADILAANVKLHDDIPYKNPLTVVAPSSVSFFVSRPL